MPSPQSSTPQLLETTSRSRTPFASSPRISTLGMPHRPKPPAAILAPSSMPSRAMSTVETTLSMRYSLPAPRVERQNCRFNLCTVSVGGSTGAMATRRALPRPEGIPTLSSPHTGVGNSGKLNLWLGRDGLAGYDAEAEFVRLTHALRLLQD